MADIDGTEQDGYVLAMTALLLIPMMVFAALAVDVGGWYVRSSEAQRAADAASLAGVVFMPNETKATTAALDTAAANGFVDQPGCPTMPCTTTSFPQVVVTKLGSQAIRVDIMVSGDTYFGSVVSPDDLTIQRFASAEYTLGVPMGNPTSAIGMGTEAGSGVASNFWLRAMNDCESRQTGDFIGAGGGCPYNPTNNPNHKPEGHTFIVDVPVDGNYELQARLTCAEFGGQQANAPMRFKLFDADDTLLNDADNVQTVPLVDMTVNRPSTAICPANGSGWSIASDPAPWVKLSDLTAAGRYVMQADNAGTAANVRSLYSLRIVPASTSGPWTCSRIGPGGSAACPNIFARDYLTAYTHANMFPSGVIGLARLYLAEIDDVHAGKTMRVELFDPADGIDSVRIIDPHGNYAPFSWYFIDCDVYGYKCGSRTEVFKENNPHSDTCMAGAVLVSCLKENPPTWDFQDRTVMIEIPLTGYTCATPAAQPKNCWWQVEYEDNTSNANETTTWGVSLTGDPIRLTE